MSVELAPGPNLVSTGIVRPRLDELKIVTRWLRNEGVIPSIDIISSQPFEAGVDPFTRGFRKMGRTAGIDVVVYDMCDDDGVLAKVNELNTTRGTTHVMVPLLNQSRTDEILAANKREVEGIHHAQYPSATPAAMIELASLGIGEPIEDKFATHRQGNSAKPERDPRVIVVGHSGQVGSKLVELLEAQHIFPTFAGRSPDDKRDKFPGAELLFGAAGSENLFAAEYFGSSPIGGDDESTRPKVIVDAGVTHNKKGEMIGSVEPGIEDSVSVVYTPVTNSIGRLNTFLNLKRAAVEMARQSGYNISYDQMLDYAKEYVGSQAVKISTVA
jgi:5,10-methylene-tetrahydrofolate dehydrogenase/methenyl tetrahydrofolate cyclohydrolase